MTLWEHHQLAGHLSLFWDGASKASLRLQVSIHIGEQGLPNKTSLYLLISPERIERVVAEPDSLLQTLEFTLSRPPFLVIPNRNWEPRDNHSKKISDLLYDLAGQMSFSLRLHIPDHVLSPEVLHSFCAAASGGGLLPRASQEAERRRLLRGGSRIIEGETLRDPAPHPASPEAPAPEYSESPRLISAPAYGGLPSSSVSGK